jgi:hypothetical protein
MTDKKTISETDRKWIAWAIAVALIVAGTLLGVTFPQLPPTPAEGDFGAQAHPGGYTNLSGLVVAGPTTFATATPAAIVDSAGLGTILEIRDATTPIAYYANGGAYTSGQGQTINNWSAVSAPTAIATATPAFVVNSAGVSQIASFRDAGTELLGVRNGGSVYIAAPTAAATAAPALIVDSKAAGSTLLEVRDAATPVFYIAQNGSYLFEGNGYTNGRMTHANAFAVAAPTSIATATPAAYIDSLAVSNIFEARAAATPVFAIEADGDVVGSVLQYGTAGQKGVAASVSITGTGTVAHGLTTVTWAVCTLAQDPDDDAGDAATVSVAISGNTVTAKAWQDDATAATETDVDINCFVIGTP